MSPPHAALITSGLVKVAASGPPDRAGVADDGIGILLSIRGPGDFVGEEGAILGEPPGGYAHHGGIRIIKTTALTSSSARVFPAWQLRRFFDSHPAALRAAAEGLCRRLAEAEARMASAAYDSADRRLARLLCDLERYGYADEAGGTRLPVNLSQAELASWIGSCRVTVDRILQGWRRRGIISTGYRTIVVHDLENLARIAGIQISRRSWNRPKKAATP